MNGCELQASGDIELYFYGELDASGQESFEHHLRACAECRRAVQELSLIRAALATRPGVDAPADGDWRRFMVRLDEAIRFEKQAREAGGGVAAPKRLAARQPLTYVPYLAMAAAATLVTSGIVYFARTERGLQPVPQSVVADRAPAPEAPAAAGVLVSTTVRSPETAFAALSEEHFERSKLVVLGLANKDPRSANDADWAYERGLASNLLSDTRLYRLAAEERGMKTLAGVMGDLELVLLQTSLIDKPDPEALEQIQRLIHKRDLVTKMDVATTGS